MRACVGQEDIQVFHSVGPQTWERIGSPLSAFGDLTPARQARIQATASGKVFVTWHEFDGNTDTGYVHLFTSYWDNQAWSSLTTSAGINQGQQNCIRPMLSIDSFGRPVVAWFESRGGGDDFAGDYVYVRRYNN